MSQIKRCHPVEVPRADSVDVDGELHTAVCDFADVGLDIVEGIDNGRDRIAPDEVLGLLVVELDATVDAVVPESIVETDVEHGGRLPLQVGVGQLRGAEDGPGIALIIECATIPAAIEGAIGGHARVGAEAQGITADTIADAELQLVEEVLVLHEVLLSDVPCSRNRGEGTPAMTRGKHRRTVAADGGLQHIAAVVAIAQTTVERNVAHGFFCTALHSRLSVHSTGVSHVVPFQVVIKVVVVPQSEAVVRVALLPRVTGHQSQLVTTGESAVEVQIGLKRLLVAEVGVASGSTIVVVVRRNLGEV